MGTSVSIFFIPMTFHYFKNYIRYVFCSRHWRGYGIHSPYVFDLVTRVVEEKLPYYKYGLVEKVREAQKKSKKTILLNGKEEKVSDLSKKWSMDKSHAQLLFRLVNNSNPGNVVALCKDMGVMAMYLSAPDAKINVCSITRDSALAEISSFFMGKTGFKSVKNLSGDPMTCLSDVLSEVGTLDFLCVDDCSDGAELDARLDLCMPHVTERTVFVLCGIYENESMTASWERVKASDKVRVTLDLFKYGIVLFNGRLQKEDYYQRYFPDFHI